MSGFVDYAEDKLLDHVLGDTEWDTDDTKTLYLALSTTVPTDAGGNVTEPVGNNYSRPSVASTKWTTSSGGSTTTNDPISFPNPSGSWGAIIGFCLYDAVTSGNPIFWGTISSITPDSPNQYEVSTGDLTVTLD